MKTQIHWVLVVVCLLAAGIQAQEPTSPPKLIAEDGHTIRDSRGDGAGDPSQRDRHGAIEPDEFEVRNSAAIADDDQCASRLRKRG